jgi:hypothetical protein
MRVAKDSIGIRRHFYDKNGDEKYYETGKEDIHLFTPSGSNF